MPGDAHIKKLTKVATRDTPDKGQACSAADFEAAGLIAECGK